MKVGTAGMHSELIQALMAPSRYAHPVDRVELVETHISWVLLAGDYAYKIKKPVDFGFLDFSALEARAHFCAEELRLNRRHASQLYLEVVPVTGTPAEPQLGGEGAAIEYAVRMRRFSGQDQFDRLLSAGRLQPEHIDQLAEALYDLHQQADPAPQDSAYGLPEQVIAPMRDNFSSLRALVKDDERQAQLQRLAEWTEGRFAALCARLLERRNNDHVRECHGDAHLANVTLFQERATLFDCLEFSPDLRWTDTMADLAFTLMDLHDRGAEGLSWRLLNRYLDLSGDYAGLDLLVFYMVYRAMVRAKVAALSLADAGSDQQAAGHLDELDNYLSLAMRLAGERRPALILSFGVSASGKSWLGERLLERCGLVRLRSDVERKRLHGLEAQARTQSEPGAGLYSQAATGRTYARLSELAADLLAAGFPVLVDATFLKREQRAPFRRLAAGLGVPFGILACTAERAVLDARLAARRAAGSDPSEADARVLQRQLDLIEPCQARDGQDLLVLDTARSDALDTATDYLERLISAR